MTWRSALKVLAMYVTAVAALLGAMTVWTYAGTRRPRNRKGYQE